MAISISMAISMAMAMSISMAISISNSKNLFVFERPCRFLKPVRSGVA